MEKLVKVAVDAMGGDHAPGEVVKGAVDAVNEKNNLKVFLVGKAPRIHEELSKYQYKNEQIEVVNAEEEISCDESPVEAIRKKKDSSMVVALKMVRIRLQMHLYQLEVQERSLLEDSLLLEGSKGSREHHWEQ